MDFDKSYLFLYAVTDSKDRGEILYKKVESALKGGVTLVQLREKGGSEEELISDAVKIKDLCHSYGVPLIINDNVSAAIKSGADGVHVGAEDESVFEIRKKTGGNFIIGATAKTVGQAIEAEKEGADYLGVGAVFPSPTKQHAIRITKEKLNEICSSVSIPAVAIGGINYDNADGLRGMKADGIAVVSAVFGCGDIEDRTKKLKEKVKEILNG